MKKIVVLSTIIAGRKNYIVPLMTRREDRKMIVNHSFELEKAKDFESIAAAEAFIPTMVNHHGRLYTASEEKVSAKKFDASRELAEEDFK